MTDEQKRFRRLYAILKTGQIDNLPSGLLCRLTDGFKEEWVRRLVSSQKTCEKQKSFLKSIIKAYNNEYLEFDKYGNSWISADIPNYLLGFQDDLELGILVGPECEEVQLPSPAMQTDAKSWSDASDSIQMNLVQGSGILEQTLYNIQQYTQASITQISALRDGSIINLTEQLKNSLQQLEQLRISNSRLQGWFDEWQELKEQVTLEKFTKSEIEELGYLDDPALMRDIVQTIFDQRQKQKQLEEENRTLRVSQERWRESPEYKQEVEKYRSELNNSITVSQICEGLIDNANFFDSNESISNFVLKLVASLRKTAFGTVDPNRLISELIIKKEQRGTELAKASHVDTTAVLRETCQSMIAVANRSVGSSLVLEQNVYPQNVPQSAQIPSQPQFYLQPQVNLQPQFNPQSQVPSQPQVPRAVPFSVNPQKLHR